MTGPTTAIELREVIENGIKNHPRSQQDLIGPSGIGTPCLRKLGHRLAQTPKVNSQVAWRPTVGTAVHKWAEGVFRADNARLGRDRWLIEARVTVGDIGPEVIQGNSDLFDTDTGTVIDWKFPGITAIKQRRAAKYPGEEYQIQSHLYGWGFVLMGFEVRHVAIYFLPAAGELGDGYYWTEPYDGRIAEAAMQRADGIDRAIRALGADITIPQLATAPDHCSHCEWWQPMATDLARACPGDPGMEVRRDKSPLTPFAPATG